MKLIIDIDEKYYESSKLDNLVEGTIMASLDAIRNGIPLPKGHGRIIDESKIEVCEWVNELEEDYPKASTDAPTIIEADGGSEEDKWNK